MFLDNFNIGLLNLFTSSSKSYAYQRKQSSLQVCNKGNRKKQWGNTDMKHQPNASLFLMGDLSGN